MFCINCGSDINENDKVCPNCGYVIGTAVNSYSQQINDNKIASLEKRIRAFLSDMGIMLVLYLGLSIFLWGLAKYVWPFAVIAYFTVTVAGRHSATWGMASKGIKVVNAKDGGKVSYAVALIRAILTILFVVTLLFLIRNKEGRRLNDILTGTMIIENNI